MFAFRQHGAAVVDTDASQQKWSWLVFQLRSFCVVFACFPCSLFPPSFCVGNFHTTDYVISMYALICACDRLEKPVLLLSRGRSVIHPSITVHPANIITGVKHQKHFANATAIFPKTETAIGRV